MIYSHWQHNSGPNRRSTARIQLPPSDSLVVEVEWNDQFIPANLADLSARGVGLKMAHDPDLQLPIGALVKVLIAHPIDGWQVLTTAEVRNSWLTGPEHVHVGLGFINEGDLFSQLDSALGRYFNRRETKRTIAAPNERTSIEVCFDGLSIEAALMDLSTGGAGIWCTDSADDLPQQHASGQITLPSGDGSTTTLEVRVAQVRSSDEGTLVGLAFEQPTSDQISMIETWISQRSNDLHIYEQRFAA
ncbi:MAG: PilZ domain-containing protein [Planctomycetota bacterium]|nr:PilZ domain-containing protein [Planctomycetota bacterium]